MCCTHVNTQMSCGCTCRGQSGMRGTLDMLTALQALGTFLSLFPRAEVTDTLTPKPFLQSWNKFFREILKSLFVMQCFHFFSNFAILSVKKVPTTVCILPFWPGYVCHNNQIWENYYTVTGNGFCDSLWEIKQERQMNHYRKKSLIFSKKQWSRY